MHEAGKGDKRRPTDDKAFDSNFDSIFGDRKPVRGSFIWDSEQGKMVAKEEYYSNHSKADSHMVLGDIQPYQSMVDGSMIEGRRQHREHLKRHSLMEVGNETKHLKAYGDYTPPKGLKEELVRNMHRVKDELRRKK